MKRGLPVGAAVADSLACVGGGVPSPPAKPPPPLLATERLLLLTLYFCTLPATDVPYDLTPEFLHELFTKHRCGT